MYCKQPDFRELLCKQSRCEISFENAAANHISKNVIWQVSNWHLIQIRTNLHPLML